MFVELCAQPPPEAQGPAARLVAARSAEGGSADLLTLDLTSEHIDELSEYSWVRVIRLARALRHRRVDPA